jgi:hypothetical protein
MKALHLEGRDLLVLPPIPDDITHLYCHSNKLKRLPDLPEGLISLDCDMNEIKELPDLPEDLLELNCAENELTELPELPSRLKELSCHYNQLTRLPELPYSLEKIVCGSMKIKELPNLPPNLRVLECDDTNLTELPELPDLDSLVISDNKIEKLTPLPETLKNLDCAKNLLRDLPELPESLKFLICSNNKLTQLPELPKGLRVLRCKRNSLTTLPKLPDSLEIIQCDENPFVEPYRSLVENFTDTSVLEIPKARIKEFIKKINILAAAQWKGFTQSDIEKFDIIFEEQAAEYALCPVCLKYVERSEACMYMKHNCADSGGFYHKELYAKFKNDEGYIGWCTICNRITKGHRHYELAPSSLKGMPDLKPSGDPFEKDCSKTNHGGGLSEKLARFRRFREYALELQDEIGEKSEQEALEELVEETWNAPLRRERKLLKGIANTKKWNINTGRFKKNEVEANAANAANIPFTGKLPTEARGRNNIMMNDDVDILRFHHKQKDGSEEKHGITKETLEDFLKDKTKNFGDESFGFCFMYPGCDARLHPAEIKGHVPAALYEDYRKKFNRKFQRGGGGFLKEADAVCVMKGGTRKRLQRSKGTRRR